jgi:hypothetical protein
VDTFKPFTVLWWVIGLQRKSGTEGTFSSAFIYVVVFTGLSALLNLQATSTVEGRWHLVCGTGTASSNDLTDSGLCRGLDHLPLEFSSLEEATPIIVVAPGLNGGKTLIWFFLTAPTDMLS